MKKISIIIPSLNQGNFIEKSITSLLDQNYPNLEIIVMDGGSTDATISILKKYEPHIIWFSEEDNGQSHAINKGIKICSGEIIAFLNSDDYSLPGSLSTVAENFEDEDVLWLTGDYKIIDTDDKPIQSFVEKYKRCLRNFSSKNMLLITNFIVQPSTFWRKSLTNKIGFFDESLKFVMDYDYWIRAYQYSTPKILTKPLSAFRIHKNSKGGSRFKEQFDEEYTVSKVYTRNRILHGLHFIHNLLIVFSYKLIKKSMKL